MLPQWPFWNTCKKTLYKKGEASGFELHTMREVDEKPSLGVAADRQPARPSDHLVFNVRGQPK
ncbi:hypothetical protein IFO68_13910 [Photobacterium sp. CAU 1568]|uniref:Uncharacterized protein n=1 Tax=Photobacterium arenosum TaxID=2774143 RepID=A0ABR9BNG0_9GAMM|nr:hypothetical protein [Photobacterium arenosum]MBD8513773.1 hypothetical protein [Photobacterium arenosum]